MIFLSLYIVGLVGLIGYGIFVGGPRTKELKLIKENEQLMEEKERLLDREIINACLGALIKQCFKSRA